MKWTHLAVLDSLQGACTVAADGVRSAACQRCLVGSEWDALRARLGTEAVRGHRQLDPTLIQGSWTSASVAAAMFRILAEELLGYSPHVISQVDGGDTVGQVTHCKGINLEVWGSGGQVKERDAQTSRTLRERNLGALVYQGLYAPAYSSFVSTHYQALTENTLQLREDGSSKRTMDAFPEDGSIGPMNLSAWCGSSTELCCTVAERESAGWTESSCVQGRWYPPQCVVDAANQYPSRNCKELYLASVGSSDGWYESMIKNGEWNFSAVYLGYTGIRETVAQLNTQKQDFLYYWWEPEYLHTLYPSQRVVLPQRDEECEDAKTGDPLLSASFCGQGSTVLKKWMSEELAQAEPDLLQLFEGWELNNGDLERLVSLENSAGGYYTIEEAACVALKTERTRAKWETWINIESPCAWKGKDYKWSEEANSCVVNKPPDLTPVVISAIIIGVILAAITVGVSLRHKQLKRYVEKLETECVADGVVDYVTPISEAIRILKIVATTRRVKQDLKRNAVVAVKNLMTKDLFKPDYEGRSLSGSANRGAMEDVVAHLDMEHPGTRQHSGSAWSLCSNRRRKSSSTGTDVSVPGTVVSAMEESAADDVVKSVDDMLKPIHTHYHSLASVGSNLMQDTFVIKGVAQGRPLTVSAMLIMRKYDLFRSLGLGEKQFARWLIAVEEGYLDVPYHNAVHASDVLSRVVSILRHEHIAQDSSLSSMCNLLAVIMATVIHDYGHPGLDNKYMVDSDSDVSRRFNQRAVLENHSVYECLEMLRRHEFNPFVGAHFNRDSLLSLVTELVLATDMADHFFLVSDFKSKISEKAKELSSDARPCVGAPHRSEAFFDGLDEKGKVKVLTIALKVADIGHLFTPFAVHSQWCSLLEDEFFRQGELEINANREPGMLKDPRKPGVTDPEHSVAFLDVIGIPLVQMWADVFPNSGVVFLEQAAANRRIYAERARMQGL
eukprot:CAMPEP_0177767984 /NCGR_PEP_ID=MMETSP0491_2-20121128/9458_1 /TAXON_ID=63592 /ORGANISM="Tetraselmis chuii, Strain PLY429" /LENGTH=953 /DNA_ID=CAMNT_0019284719 /DNA_START=3442 /DNA_END=6304 /DNA_ORIENTATION=+